MNRFRVSITEMLMLMALCAILTSFVMHVDRQVTMCEVVQAIELSPDRQQLARASSRGVVVFDMGTRRVVARFPVWAGCVAFSPDARWIATGEIDGRVQLWDRATGKLSRSFEGHSGWVRAIAFSPTSDRLYTASRDGKVKVWGIPEGKWVATYQLQSEIESMALSPDGRRLAVGTTKLRSNRHEIEVWSTETHSSLTTLNGPEYCYVYNLAFGPDSRMLAIGLSIPTVRIWDVSEGTMRVSLPTAEGRDLVAFSPSGKRLVTGCYDGVQVWDTTTGAQVVKLRGHSDEVLLAWFSDDEATLTTAGRDGSVATWDLESARKTSRISGLTVWPHPVPWIILTAFGAWLIAWCALAYRARRRTIGNAHDQSVAGFILVPFAATCFVAHVLTILWIVLTPMSGPDPISALFGLSLPSFALLACVGLTVFVRAVRQRVIFWIFSVAAIMVALCYNLHLLVQFIASV